MLPIFKAPIWFLSLGGGHSNMLHCGPTLVFSVLSLPMQQSLPMGEWRNWVNGWVLCYATVQQQSSLLGFLFIRQCVKAFSGM
jgi:hypothetical protein